MTQEQMTKNDGITHITTRDVEDIAANGGIHAAPSAVNIDNILVRLFGCDALEYSEEGE